MISAAVWSNGQVTYANLVNIFCWFLEAVITFVCVASADHIITYSCINFRISYRINHIHIILLLKNRKRVSKCFKRTYDAIILTLHLFKMQFTTKNYANIYSFIYDNQWWYLLSFFFSSFFTHIYTYKIIALCRKIFMFTSFLSYNFVMCAIMYQLNILFNNIFYLRHR